VISTYPTPKQTILCIDNDEVMLRYEKTLLERSGYTVLSAVSAEQGLRLATICKCDAVLLDYDMPVMNGSEVASEIKRLRPELIVIMVSGSEMPVSAALAAVDAFIPKLEVIRELLPVIAELCGRGRGQRHKARVRLEDRQRAS
jgi:CheY-like chemotaxis protein